MDNLVDRYYDPATDVTYDWDEEFQCYVGYIESKLNSADPFYYMYLEDEEEEIIHSPHLASELSSTKNVLDLLDPKKKILSKGTQIKPRVKDAGTENEVDESDLYGLDTAKKSAAPVAKGAAAKASPGSGKRPSIEEIRKELRAEVQQAAKEGNGGAAARRSLTRRLTRKLTTIGGDMSVQEQLNLIADAKKEAGEMDLDDEAINERTAKENAAAKAREVALQHLSKKPAPVKEAVSPKPKEAPPKKSEDPQKPAAGTKAGGVAAPPKADSKSPTIQMTAPKSAAEIKKSSPDAKAQQSRDSDVGSFSLKPVVKSVASKPTPLAKSGGNDGAEIIPAKNDLSPKKVLPKLATPRAAPS